MSWTPGLGANITNPVLSGSALSPENVALNLQFNALDHQLQVRKDCHNVLLQCLDIWDPVDSQPELNAPALYLFLCVYKGPKRALDHIYA